MDYLQRRGEFKDVAILPILAFAIGIYAHFLTWELLIRTWTVDFSWGLLGMSVIGALIIIIFLAAVMGRHWYVPILFFLLGRLLDSLYGYY